MSDKPCFDLFSGIFEEFRNENETERGGVQGDVQERKGNILAYINGNQSKATKSRTVSDMRKLQSFLAANGTTEPAESLEPSRLDLLLAEFFKDLKRDDGSEMEPGTVKGVQYSIERYLCEHGYGEKITKFALFTLSQSALLTKMKILKGHGKGNRPNKAQPLTEEDEEILWQKGVFGLESPLALITTLWWFFTVGFGLRGRQESTQMCWGDIKLKTEHGEEFLEFNERLTKTRQGDVSKAGSSRSFAPKLWANDNKSRCPVAAYKKMEEKRPEEMKTSEARFVLSIDHGKNEADTCWFKRAPMGEKTLGGLMAKAAEKAGLKGRFVNHSGRKTAVKRLLDNGHAPQHVAQLMGHKNTGSLLAYTEADVEVQRKMAKTVLLQENMKPVTAKEQPAIGGQDGDVKRCTMSNPVFNNCVININVHGDTAVVD